MAILHATQLAGGKAAAQALVAAFRIGGRMPLHDAPAVIE